MENQYESGMIINITHGRRSWIYCLGDGCPPYSLL